MKRFGLIGRTLKHSFSKGFFEKKFSEQGITNCSYENFELPAISDFPNLIANNPDLQGLNITIPYKEEVLQFLNSKNEIVPLKCYLCKILKKKCHQSIYGCIECKKGFHVNCFTVFHYQHALSGNNKLL